MPSRLETQEGLREQLAELLHEGQTNNEIAEALGISPRAVMRYKKDAVVQSILSEKREARINSVTTKIDSALEARIGDPELRAKMPTKELLEIRRELLGPAAQRLTINRGVDEGEAMAELMKKVSDDPALAAALGLGGLADEDDVVDGSAELIESGDGAQGPGEIPEQEDYAEGDAGSGA